MDEHLQKYFEGKFDHFEYLISRMEKAELACRKDLGGRVNALEITVATNMASTWRGAFVIGTCSLVGATIAVFLGHVLGKFL